MNLVRLQVDLQRHEKDGEANDDMDDCSTRNLEDLEQLAKKAIESATFKTIVKLLS